MGCDIHPSIEVRGLDGEWRDEHTPERLCDRSYARFAFLTGGMVRNDCNMPAVLPAPRGFPEDGLRVKEHFYENHNASYLTLKELLDVDYDQQVQGYSGENVSLLEFLGEGWLMILDELVDMAPPGDSEGLRIVFDFDN